MSALPRTADPAVRRAPYPPQAVEIRLGGPSTQAACLALDDSYETGRMWQVAPRAFDEPTGLAPGGADTALGVILQPLRLPRPLHEPGLAQLQPPAARHATWQAADCILVALRAGAAAALPPPDTADPANSTDPTNSIPHSAFCIPHSDLWGFVVLNALANTHIGWISELAVAPEQRGRGVGRMLIEAARAWAAAPLEHGGGGQLRALAVRLSPRNYPAINLARHAGFQFAGYTDYTPAGGDLRLFFLARLDSVIS